MYALIATRRVRALTLVTGLFLAASLAQAEDTAPAQSQPQPSTQEKVKERVHHAAKTVKEGARKVGDAVEHGASVAVGGIKKGAAKADHAIRHVAHKVDPKRNPEAP